MTAESAQIIAERQSRFLAARSGGLHLGPGGRCLAGCQSGETLEARLTPVHAICPMRPSGLSAGTFGRVVEQRGFLHPTRGKRSRISCPPATELKRFGQAPQRPVCPPCGLGGIPDEPLRTRGYTSHWPLLQALQLVAQPGRRRVPFWCDRVAVDGIALQRALARPRLAADPHAVLSFDLADQALQLVGVVA